LPTAIQKGPPFLCDFRSGGCYKLNMTPDTELLRRYADTRSEDAFAELVQRHVNLVYSTVLRRLNGDAQLAQDASQSVFADLARKASSLSRRRSITGWLYTSAHFAAIQLVRQEGRRRERELKLMSELKSQGEIDPDWEKLRPVLDDAMLELKETDREAILLRYFENRPLSEVGVRFGVPENTARMRVQRALDKLRALLARRGITTTSSLVAAISANAVEIAPASVTAALAVSSATSVGVGTFALFKLMIATKAKLALVALAITGAAVVLVKQIQTQSQLRANNDSLCQQLAQMQSENENLSNQFVTLSRSRSIASDELKNLLRLRREVAMLRDRTNELGRLAQESHQAPATASTESTEQTDSSEYQEKIAKMNDAKVLALAESMYAHDNQGRLATNAAQIYSYMSTSDSFTNDTYSLTGSNSFDLVYTGSINGLTNAVSIIMIRESEPWQTPDGKWARTYGFVDGHSEIHVEPTDNFDAFEQQHMIPQQ
jgi:RNA polymerase sigma factor (sigma-70 family)